MGFNPKTFRSLEFLVLVLGAVGPWLADMASSQISHQQALVCNILAAGVYALARPLAKWKTDVKDYWHSTEFWVFILGSIAAMVGVAAETIGGAYWLQLQGLLGAAIMIGNAIRKDPMVASGAVPVVAIAGYADEIPLPDTTDHNDGDDSKLGATEDPMKDS